MALRTALPSDPLNPLAGEAFHRVACAVERAPTHAAHPTPVLTAIAAAHSPHGATAMSSTTVLSSPSSPASDHRRVWSALALWGAAGLTLAASGVVGVLPRPAIPLLIWSPVIAAVVAYRRSAALRAFVAAVDLRAVVLYHVVRVLFGTLFLVEMRAGNLPASFAMLAGPGDIVAGTLAVPAALLATRTDRTSRALLLAWNALGLLDILAVFLTAQRLIFVVGDPKLFETFQRMPYAALPLLVVPLVLVTHLVVFLRLRAPQR